MSAYGDIPSSTFSTGILPATVWSTDPLNREGVAPPSLRTSIFVHHLRLDTAQQYDGLIDYLWGIFAKVVEEGMTYPQEEEITKEAFQSYFFSADVFLGLVAPQDAVDLPNGSTAPEGVLETSSKDWKNSIAGFYYVKPNYPGRSSHICNGGFVVPHTMRGKRFGLALGKSYLHYGPLLGYQASVFNLVYVNNTASVRIWESLGFHKAGRIPSAGRLKRSDGNGEEFVDAWVFYKKFSD